GAIVQPDQPVSCGLKRAGSLAMLKLQSNETGRCATFCEGDREGAARRPGTPPETGRVSRMGGQIARRVLSEAEGRPVVQISTTRFVRRRAIMGRAVAAEVVQSTSHDRIEYRFRAPSDLLVVYERGARREGETFIDGAGRSTLRDFARK